MTPSASGQLAMTSSVSGHPAMTQSASGVLRGGRASVPYAQPGNPGNPRSFSLQNKTFLLTQKLSRLQFTPFHKYLRMRQIDNSATFTNNYAVFC
jgi:hypothetical protein